MDRPGAAAPLARYLLEIAPAANGYRDLHELTERSRAACAELTAQNVPVRLLRAVFLPEDGAFLFVLDAASAPAVEEAGRRAQLPVRRISVLLAPEARASSAFQASRGDNPEQQVSRPPSD